MLRDWAIWATGWLEWNMVSPILWPPLAWYWLVPSLTKATGWWFSLVSVPPRNTAIPMTVYGTPPPNKYSQVPSSPKVSHGILMITSVLAVGTFTGCPFPPHTTLPSLQLHTALPPQFCYLFQVAPPHLFEPLGRIGILGWKHFGGFLGTLDFSSQATARDHLTQ